MAKSRPSFNPAEQAVVDTNPSVQAAVRLFHHYLAIDPNGVDLANLSRATLARIDEVIAYDPVNPRYGKQFEAKTRQPDEVFVGRGRTSMINQVVEPACTFSQHGALDPSIGVDGSGDHGSVNWIKEVTVRGTRQSLSELLVELLGSGAKKFDNVNALDGMSLVPRVGETPQLLLVRHPELVTSQVAIRKALGEKGFAHLERMAV